VTQRPRISVVMCNFNKAPYLDEAVRSILAQTLEEWELVIVDDGSSDGSVPIIEKWAAADSRIRLVRNSRNRGYIGSLQVGIGATCGTVVGILDSDDALEPTALERVVSLHDARPQLALVLTQWFWCDADLNIVSVSRNLPEHLQDNALWMRGPNAFRAFKKAAYDAAGGVSEDYLFAEDFDLIFRLEEVGGFERIDEPLYYYRQLPESQSHAPGKWEISRQARARALHDAWVRRRGRPELAAPLPRLMAWQAAGIIYSHYLGDRSEALRFAGRLTRMGGGWWNAARAFLFGLRMPRFSGGRLLLIGPDDFKTSSGVVAGGAVRRRLGGILPGHWLYGGDFSVLQDGVYEAEFLLDWSALSLKRALIADVYEGRSERVLQAGVLGYEPHERSIRFAAREGDCVQFRLEGWGRGASAVYGVYVRRIEENVDPAQGSG